MSIEVKYHTCQHCGYTGEEVVKTIGYIGGLGYVEGSYCLDMDACWQRWELRHKCKKCGGVIVNNHECINCSAKHTDDGELMPTYSGIKVVKEQMSKSGIDYEH